MISKSKMKQAALKYLQEQALELRVLVPALVSAKVVGDKIVLSVSEELKDIPALEYDGIKFNVSVQIENAAKIGKNVDEEKRKQILAKYPSVAKNKDVYVPDMTEAISPKGGKVSDSKAYEAWKERHAAVKKGED